LLLWVHIHCTANYGWWGNSSVYFSVMPVTSNTFLHDPVLVPRSVLTTSLCASRHLPSSPPDQDVSACQGHILTPQLGSVRPAACVDMLLCVYVFMGLWCCVHMSSSRKLSVYLSMTLERFSGELIGAHLALGTAFCWAHTFQYIHADALALGVTAQPHLGLFPNIPRDSPRPGI